MEISTPKWSAMKRGPVDGTKFFSKSIFRSRSFVLATVVSLTNAALLLFLILRHWGQLSDMKIFALAWAVFLIVEMWWRARAYLERIRELFMDGSIKEVAPGSPLDTVLGLAAGVTNELLFSSAIAILPLLLFLGFFLGHAC